MSDDNFFSYNKIKSGLFTFVADILFFILCLFIFDKGLLGVTVELEDSLLIVWYFFSDPTLYVPLIGLFGLFVYRSMKHNKINTIEVINKKVNSVIVWSSIVVGIALMSFGYFQNSSNGPLWVFLGLILIGGIIIGQLSIKLFKRISPQTKEEFKSSYLSLKNRVILGGILAILGGAIAVLAFI